MTCQGRGTPSGIDSRNLDRSIPQCKHSNGVDESAEFTGPITSPAHSRGKRACITFGSWKDQSRTSVAPRISISCFCWAALLLVDFQRPPHAQAQEARVFTGILENDLLYNPAPGKHQDRHYTQGLKMVFLDRAEPLWRWADRLGLDSLASHLPSLWLDPTGTNYALTFGQNIYTPENNRSTNLVAADRPYAGWLYVGAAVQRRGTNSWNWPILENFELNLGVIGPEAQGEWAQNTVHQFRRLPTFEGWDNQLRTEPAFLFKYGRAWKWTPTAETGRFFDVLPHGGIHLGSVMTSVELGLTARIGLNLPDDFAIQGIDSPLLVSPGANPRRIGFYLFGRVEGRAVARNAFLDGNLYQASHHVPKEPLVADLSCGTAVTLGRHCELGWTFVTRTAEFRAQKGFDQFGSLTARWSWDY